MTVEAVCFDLDDTLYDYEDYAEAGLRAAADLLEARTGERLHEELRTLYFEDEVTDGTFDTLLERHDLSADPSDDLSGDPSTDPSTDHSDDLSADPSDDFSADPSADLAGDLAGDMVDAFHSATAPLSPYDDAVDVLSLLAPDHHLGLITDGRGGDAKLDRLDIRDHFDAVLVTPTIGSSKRDPAVFERVFDELSVSPSAAMYVGDDPRVDFRVPNELGMRTVRLRRGRYVDLEPTDDAAAPDHEIGGLASLLFHL